MTTSLVPVDFSQLPSTQIGDDSLYAGLTQGGTFLKRIQLYTKGEAIDTGKIRPGHFGVPDNDAITDLGESIDIVPLARRPKALDMSDKTAVTASYDLESDEFKRIAARSDEPNSGCQHGISFLVVERTTGEFYEFFFGNKSSRPEAKSLAPYLALTQADIDRRQAAKADVTGLQPHGPVPATLKTRYIKGKKGSWHVPVVFKCSTPFANFPSQAECIKEITRFLTAKTEGSEKVEEAPAEDGKKKRAR
jgi:hypothetical protein